MSTTSSTTETATPIQDHLVTPSPCPPAPYPEPTTPDPEPLSPPPAPLLHPGALSLLLGDPGVGKSLVALDIAARLTCNSPPPPHPFLPHPPYSPDEIPSWADPASYRPAHIFVASLEDDFYTLAARLLEAGADRDFICLDKHHRLSLVPPKPEREYVPPGACRPPAETPLPSLIQTLNHFLRQHINLKLVVLDPLPAFLGTRDSYYPSAIRQLLEPLLNLAARYSFAVLGISHLNKSTHKKHIFHRILGSQTYLALARSVYLVTNENPNHNPNPNPNPNHIPNPNPTATRRLLIPLKNNLAPANAAFAFSITDTASSTGRILWEPSPITNHPLLTDPTALSNHDQHAPAIQESQLHFAQSFLQQSLAAGPIPSITLLKEARSVGISQRTLERARYFLNIQCRFDRTLKQWKIHAPPNMPPAPPDDQTLDPTPPTPSPSPPPCEEP